MAKARLEKQIENHVAGSVANRAASVPQQAGGNGVVSTTAHTPGPWVIFDDGELRQLIVMPAGRGGEIATVQFERADNAHSREQDANADLIAAAPDMLAALKQAALILNSEYESGTRRERCATAIRAAIAKAEGRAS